jgi:hypothetical protein
MNPFVRSAVAVLALSCSTEALAQAPVANATGCCELRMEPWVPELSLGADLKYLTPPARILLDSVPAAGMAQPGQAVVRPAPGAEPYVHQFSFWEFTDSSTIRISWTTGFSGLWMELSPAGRDWEGTAFSSWDFSRTRQRSSVRAIRISCAPA